VGFVPFVPERENEIQSFDQAHEQLDRLGDWTGVIGLAATKCPGLLEAARQSNRDFDHNPAPIGQYFHAWRALFRAVRGQNVSA
jgi:hypothetical protein